jgi:hypothetical protein
MSATFVLNYLILACIEQNEKKIIMYKCYNNSLRGYFCEEKTECGINVQK